MTSTSPARTTDMQLEGLDPAVLEILASRICHDLISPVGAVHNGVEFLQEMGPEAGNEAVELIAHSAQQAASKLQIFRLAYGAGGRDPNIKPDDVKKAFAGLFDTDKKIKQDWDSYAINTENLPLGFCKILAGTLMLAQESMPKGGTLSVTTAANGGIVVTATGTDATPRPQYREALSRALPVTALDPRLIHPYVLGVLAGQYGYAVTVIDTASGQASYQISVV